MKSSNKVIAEAISEVVGADAIPVIKKLMNRKNFSEFKLADALDQEVNETRRLLYKLYQYNLVYFVRKKDKKKGWYIYYWNFNHNQIKRLLRMVKQEKIERLNDKLRKEENGNFFVCSNKCVRLEFEQAIDFDFKCPECGEVMNQENNSKEINSIQKELEMVTQLPY